MVQTTGKLFKKAVIALSIVSMVPLVLIGWHMMSMNNRVLQSEILDKQRTMAHRIAFLISENVSRQTQFISIFSDLHSTLSEHVVVIDQEDLDYLRSRNPAIAHLSVLNTKGRQLFYSGKPAERFSYASELNNILQSCIRENKEYVGPISRSHGHLYVLMAYPLHNARANQESQVLVAEIDLADLEKTLQTSYEENMQAAVVASDGNVISSSTMNGDALPQEESFALRQQLQQFKRFLADKENGKVKLPNGDDWLISQAKVSDLDWTVYVYQPDHIIRTLFLESTFYSVWTLLLILLVVAGFVAGVSYWVLRPIVRPVQYLQKAAVKLEQEEDYTPHERDLIIPDNEIGELARVFLQMTIVLRERKNALLIAQKELTSMNKILEQRVQQRTAELKAATDELVKSERLAAIGQMASIISHEIRNPLAVISNATRLIKVIQPPTDPKLIKQFSIIESEIQQANGIIGEVLGFARSRDLMLSMIDLNSYLHDLVMAFPLPHEVHVELNLDQESVRLKIDSEEIKQALRNILSNACEAMPNGGHITLSTRVGKKAVCIAIADTGTGISEELKEKIFAPFFTTKARGTGLGLAVVRKAISRHKGKLFVHNLPKQGAVFEIYLRIYKKIGDTRYG